MLNKLRGLGAIVGQKIDHPLGDPRELRRIVDEIPGDNAFRALDEVVGWLESLADVRKFSRRSSVRGRQPAGRRSAAAHQAPEPGLPAYAASFAKRGKTPVNHQPRLLDRAGRQLRTLPGGRQPEEPGWRAIAPGAAGPDGTPDRGAGRYPEVGTVSLRAVARRALAAPRGGPAVCRKGRGGDAFHPVACERCPA